MCSSQSNKKIEKYFFFNKKKASRTLCFRMHDLTSISYFSHNYGTLVVHDGGIKMRCGFSKKKVKFALFIGENALFEVFRNSIGVRRRKLISLDNVV